MISSFCVYLRIFLMLSSRTRIDKLQTMVQSCFIGTKSLSLIYIFSMTVFALSWQTVWPAKPKMFTIWLFTENICKPCSRSFIILPFTFGIGISVWYMVQTKIHFFLYVYSIKPVSCIKKILYSQAL